MNNIRFMEIAPDQKHELRMDAQSHFGTFEVKDDATLWQKVNKLAHSTFDRSKFTVVGSPNITADGIAQPFTTSNRLSTGVQVGTLAGKSWEITTAKMFYSATSLTTRSDLISASTADIFNLCYSTIAKNVQFIFKTGTSGAYEQKNISYSIDFTQHTSMQIRATFDITTGVYSLFVNVDDAGFELVNSYTATTANKELYVINESPTNILNIASSAFPVIYPQDLKYIEIKANGVEVFSGNKTGIDTIKPMADFSVTTRMYCFKQSTNTVYANGDIENITPTELYDSDGRLITQNASGWQIVTEDSTTKIKYNGNEATYTSGSNITLKSNPSLPFDANIKITEDGFASTSTNSKGYIRACIYEYPANVKHHRVKLRCKIKGNPTSATGIIHMPLTSTRIGVSSSSKQIYMRAGTPESFYVITAPDSTAYAFGDVLEFDILQTPTSIHVKVFNITQNSEVTNLPIDNIVVSFPDTAASGSVLLFAELNTGNIDTAYCNDNLEIDLNSVKVYLDDVLIDQQMLKIPYTEAELNQKVVDVACRPRVKDLFEQVGYNGYHTIDEANKNFTLPTHKFSDVIEHKENGLTVAEQRVDQTLTIRGACEQGIDVNLPMEFFSADSYAVFGVGTTGTNTASKFTPAADGNYIAIGKGKV